MHAVRLKVRPSLRWTTGCRRGQSLMPSANPGGISAKTRPPRNFRPSTTSKIWMRPGPSGSWEMALSEMYSRDSSGEKHSPLGPDQIVGCHRYLPGYSVQPVDPRGLLDLCSLSLVSHQNSIARVSEPNGSVGMNNHVVRGVQRFPVEAVQQHGETPVVLGAGNPA